MKILLVITIALLLGACTGPQKFTTPCRQLSKQEIMAALQRSTTNAEMRTAVDTARGVLYAQTDTSWIGASQGKSFHNVYEWTFIVTDGQIVGRAIAKTLEKNEIGQYRVAVRMWYADHVHGDHDWYWIVRNDIDQLCGAGVQWSEDKLSDIPPPP